MGKTVRLGTGIIKREAVDTSLTNLGSGLRKAREKVEQNINVAWGSYADALSTAAKSQKEADKTASNTLKQDLDHIEVAHQKSVVAGKGNFEAAEQKREAARSNYKRELEHSQENFDRKALEAAGEFRRLTGEFLEDFAADVNDVVENFRASHP
jgi:hypothetical protein